MNRDVNVTENMAYDHPDTLFKATPLPAHMSELNMSENTAYGQLAFDDTEDNTNTTVIYDQVNSR